MIDNFLSKTDFDLLTDKKYFYFLTIFIYIEYYWTIIADIVLKEIEPIFE